MKKHVLVLSIILIFSFGIKISLAQGGSWVKKKNMSVAKNLMSTGVVNGIIYAIGGSLDAYTSTSDVEAYNAATDSWTAKAHLPQELCGTTAATVNDKIYVIGGSTSVLGEGYVVDNVYEYESDSNSWTRKSNIPTPLAYAAADAVNGKIYVIGGAPFGFNSAYKTVYEYNPATDTWTKKSDMPTARFIASATVVDGKIYVFGGAANATLTGLSALEVYDPSLDTWAVKGPMPTPRAAHASSAVSGNIYIFTGSTGYTILYNDVLEYNPTLDTWATMTPIPTPRVAPAACSIGGKIYVIGGTDNSNTRLTTVEEYNPASRTDIPTGNVSGTWTLLNSPYYVNGEITVPNGETLTIEPGVNVVFTGHYKFNVQGRLLAVGTQEDTITFTAQDTSTGWWGIRFINTPSTNDSSKIVYCALSYGKANSGNDTDRCGGAICIVNDNKVLISNCLICFNMNEGSLSVHFGGAIAIWSSSAVIEKNIICYNRAVGNHAGAIGIVYDPPPVIRNNVIYENHAAGGGAFVIIYTNPVLINNTIVYNHADLPGSQVSHGGAACIISSTPEFFNNILFGNTAPVGQQVNLQSGSQPNFRFSDIESGIRGFSSDFVNGGGGYEGTYESNIETDPLFFDADSNDYHLSAKSPCIGAGSDSIWINPDWYRAPHSDYDGNVRPNPVGSKPDIGAFESPLGLPLTSIQEGSRQLPNGFQLYQNYPDPFNPTTIISYSIPSTSHVRLAVYDIFGQEVAVLISEVRKAGIYDVSFSGANLASGVYFYRLSTGNFTQAKKMLLVK
jgi:N-acetylneuraminic acid mutarotase